MEDQAKLIESLLEKVTNYGTTGYELAKLKAINKITDVWSSVVPHAVVMVIAGSFMLFASLGLALWLGEILGKIWFGFFIVAAFYGVIGMITHFIIHKWLKKHLCNYFIQQLLK